MTRTASLHALRAPLVFAAIALLGYGFVYEVLATTLCRLAFPHAAQGSLVERDGRVIGSTLIAQPFADPRWFAPRPSAAGFDPMKAAGSNLARTNPELGIRIARRRAEVAAREGVAASDVPDGLATASASGVDPDLSPAAARLQVARVARARGLDRATVEGIVAAHVRPPTFGFLGAPRVDVLELNLALDAAEHAPAAAAEAHNRSP